MPKSRHLHATLAGEQDVRGFHVAVDDAGVVGCLQRFGNLAGDLQCLGERDGTALQAALQGLAFDQLQHQEVDGVGLLEAVDRADVGVVERRQQLGFALEPGEPVGVGGEVVGEDLDGDVALQLGVTGAVDLPHTPRAERFQDLVMTEGCTDHERPEVGRARR